MKGYAAHAVEVIGYDEVERRLENRRILVFRTSRGTSLLYATIRYADNVIAKRVANSGRLGKPNRPVCSLAITEKVY